MPSTQRVDTMHLLQLSIVPVEMDMGYKGGDVCIVLLHITNNHHYRLSDHTQTKNVQLPLLLCSNHQHQQFQAVRNLKPRLPTRFALLLQ